jgi:Tfp pilus assembly protein PilF
VTGILDASPALRDAIAAAGFAPLGPPALADALFEALRAEAAAQRSSGWGKPLGAAVDHDAWRANLGPKGFAYATAPETLALIGSAVGEPVSFSGEASCYTYYETAGSFLGRHCDRLESCAYTLILYLEAEVPPAQAPSAGMTLLVHGEPPTSIATLPNRLVLGRGAQVWHERPPLASGERVVALTACYTVARDREPLLPPIAADPHRAAILVDEGMAAWNGGDNAMALERFERAVTLDPMSDAAWAGCGFVLWSERRLEEALVAFTEAARRDGAVASHWSNIGLCLRDLGAFDRAIGAFRAALAIDPAYAPAINEWGNVLQDMGHPAEALDFYARSLALDPERPVVHHNLGVAFSRIGERGLAMEAFRAALMHDPDYSHSLEEIGVILADAGEVEAARELWERAATPRARMMIETHE